MQFSSSYSINSLNRDTSFGVEIHSSLNMEESQSKTIKQNIQDVANRAFKLVVRILVWGPTLLASRVTKEGQVLAKLKEQELSTVNNQENLVFNSSENTILVTENATETKEIKKKLIQDAKTSVLIAGSYCGGEILDEILDSLKQKIEENSEFQAYLLTSPSFLTSKNITHLKEVKKLYPNQFHYLITHPRWVILPHPKMHENHAKILLVDGQHFVAGGSNLEEILARSEKKPTDQLTIKEKMFAQGACDMDMAGTGPLGAVFNHQFGLLWNKWQAICVSDKSKRETFVLPQSFLNQDLNLESNSPTPLKKDFSDRLISQVNAEIFMGGPEQGKHNNCKRIYLQMIQSAQKSITIAHMAINNRDIEQALIEAAGRGVKITLITNSKHKDSPTCNWILGRVNKSHYHKIKKSCPTLVKVYEYCESKIIYHKKVLIVDEETTLCGSFNITTKSIECDDEILILTRSEEIAKRTLNVLEKDITKSREYQESHNLSLIDCLVSNFSTLAVTGIYN